MVDIKRIKQLAGLEPLIEAWDPDDLDRYTSADNSFGVSKSFDRNVNNPSAVRTGVEGDPNSNVVKFPGVRPPHVGPKASAAAPKGPPRRLTAKTIDPEIARQLAGLDADDDVAMAADAGEAPLAPTTQGPAVPADPNAPVFARGDKSAKASEWLAANPNASRGEFMRYAAAELGMGGHYANQFYYGKGKAIRMAARTADPAAVAAAASSPDIVEFWLVKNVNGGVLAEGTGYDVPIWTTFDKISVFEPKIFESELYAKKAVEHLNRFGYGNRVEVVREACDESE